MSNSFSTFIKKKVVRKNQNLVSLDEPFQVFANLLSGHQVGHVVDAGASNGSLSRRLMEHFPQATVYGFEPNPDYRTILEGLAGQNSRFSPQYLALGKEEGTCVLNVTESLGNTSLYTPGARLKDYDDRGTEVKAQKEVEIVTLDQWAQRSGVDKVEVMKFDIQGGELDAMQGAAGLLSDSTLVVYSEILFNSLYEGGAIFSDIDMFLRTCGFVLYDLYKPKYDKRGLLLWGNATFVHAGRMGL